MYQYLLVQSATAPILDDEQTHETCIARAVFTISTILYDASQSITVAVYDGWYLTTPLVPVRVVSTQ